MPKCIIYSRFSPRRNADTCQSIETQVEQCRAYAAAHGLTVAGEFEDRALSGSEEDRPGLWAAVDSLKAGDVLLVYMLDRLARSTYLSHIIEQAVAKKKAKIVSAAGEGTWKDEPGDELIREILKALAQYERRVIGIRTRVAMLRHQREGRRMSYLTPFGWMLDPADGARLVECAAEQATIKAAVVLKATGLGVRGIARELEKTGAVKRAKRWDHVQVARILKRAAAVPASP
jgi:DNA invertase Pin-like site-specific DNA recombinase